MSGDRTADHVSVDLELEVFEAPGGTGDGITFSAIHGEVMTAIRKGDRSLFVLMTSEQLETLVSQLAGRVAAVAKANTTGPGTVQ